MALRLSRLHKTPVHVICPAYICDIGHLYMPLVDELVAIHLVTFCGTVGFRRLKALKSHISVTNPAIVHLHFIRRTTYSHLA